LLLLERCEILSSKFKPRRIGLATEHVRGTGIWIPGAGGGTSAGGGEYGAEITDDARTFAITREPVAHRVVFTVAHDIFDNWFELELEGDEIGEQSKVFDKAVQDELNRLKAKRELALMAVYERAYGYAIILLGYEQAGDFDLSDPVGTPTALREIKAYAETQISKVDVEKDKNDPRYGLPKIYHIKRSSGVGALKVHYSRVIHFATRRKYEENKHEWEGMSVLDPIWDDVVTLRNIRWSMGQTMFRYGAGFPKITLSGADKAKLEAYEQSGIFSNISARTYFLGNETQDIEFIGTAGRALDPLNYYLPPMEHISAGSGIPLAILRGVQAGALTGSEVNQMEYYGLISDEQTAYEPGITELINAILKVGLPNGEAKQKKNFKFNWLGGFEMDEQKKAEVKRTEAETLQIQGQWHTLNEIRKMEDPTLPDLPGEEGTRLLGAPSFQPFESGEKFHVEPHVDGSSTVTKFKRSRRR